MLYGGAQAGSESQIRPTEEEGQRPQFWSGEIHVQDPRAPFGCGRPTQIPVVRPTEQRNHCSARGHLSFGPMCTGHFRECLPLCLTGEMPDSLDKPNPEVPSY